MFLIALLNSKVNAKGTRRSHFVFDIHEVPTRFIMKRRRNKNLGEKNIKQRTTIFDPMNCFLWGSVKNTM